MAAKRSAAVSVPMFEIEKKAAQTVAESCGVSITAFCRGWIHEGMRLRRLPHVEHERESPGAGAPGNVNQG